MLFVSVCSVPCRLFSRLPRKEVSHFLITTPISSNTQDRGYVVRCRQNSAVLGKTLTMVSLPTQHARAMRTLQALGLVLLRNETR